MGEHGEAVENIVEGDSFQLGAVSVDEVEFEVVAELLYVFVPIVHVARKDEPFPIRVV